LPVGSSSSSGVAAAAVDDDRRKDAAAPARTPREITRQHAIIGGDICFEASAACRSRPARKINVSAE